MKLPITPLQNMLCFLTMLSFGITDFRADLIPDAEIIQVSQDNLIVPKAIHVIITETLSGCCVAQDIIPWTNIADDMFITQRSVLLTLLPSIVGILEKQAQLNKELSLKTEQLTTYMNEVDSGKWQLPDPDEALRTCPAGTAQSRTRINGDLSVNGKVTVDGTLNLCPTFGTGVMSIDSAGLVSAALTVDHAVQVGNSSGTLTSLTTGTDGQVLIGATGLDPAFATLTTSNNSIQYTTGAGTLNIDSTPIFGNVLRVDSVFGNDATAAPNSLPYLTINAALADAVAGDLVWIFPGTYAESFTIPDGVAVRGLSTGVVTISKTVAVDTDLITMGENTRLEDVTLRLTAASHVQLRGIVFPGTTSATAKVRTIVLTVDNSTAVGVGPSNVYGVHSNGTGLPGEETSAIRASTIIVHSTGNGTKRGILVDTANDFHMRDCNIVVTSAGGGGSYIGVETNNAAALFTARTSTINGASADISQTLGTMTIVTTDLLNFNANGLGFTTEISPSILVWADPGTLPAAVRFMRPGTAAVTATELAFIRAPQSLIAKSLTARVNTAPGGANVATFTLRKNSVDTALVVTLTGAQTSNTNNDISVSFTAGDSISIKTETTGGVTADTVVSVDLY